MTGDPGKSGNRPTATRAKNAYFGVLLRYRRPNNCIPGTGPAARFPKFPGFPPRFRSGQTGYVVRRQRAGLQWRGAGLSLRARSAAIRPVRGPTRPCALHRLL
jgi:hypothetical protein